jgi:hypothetical protein
MHINDPGIRLDLEYFGVAMKMGNMLLITNLLQWVKIMFTMLGGGGIYKIYFIFCTMKFH